MNNPDLIFYSLETIFWEKYIKYLNSLVRIRDPGWKKVGSGIRDKHPGSSTLLYSGVVVRDLHGSTLIWLSWIRILIGNEDPGPGA
jgi:hypothetical protein